MNQQFRLFLISVSTSGTSSVTAESSIAERRGHNPIMRGKDSQPARYRRYAVSCRDRGAARRPAQRLEMCTSQVALELIIRCPGRPVGDATNFLGGIADVLQGKAKHRNINLDHLGDLREVALYADNGLISRISDREEPADIPSFTVRISNLASPDTADIMGWS
jgi:hypothetical protein